MNTEPLLIIGAVDAALVAAQAALVTNRLANVLLGAGIAACGYILSRGQVTPTTNRDGLP